MLNKDQPIQTSDVKKELGKEKRTYKTLIFSLLIIVIATVIAIGLLIAVKSAKDI